MNGTRGPRGRRIGQGARVRDRELVSIAGGTVPVPDPGRLVHLQFRRFAGCPVCNMHLQSFVRRSDAIAAAAVREVVVFHSTVGELRKYEGALPFDVIADPKRRLYREFGVESSPRALLDPRVWLTIVRAVLRSLRGVVFDGQPMPPLIPAGGSLGLPADFLIGPDGRVLASWYGVHADDQWSVDQVLALAGRSRMARVAAT
jgi:peroxiredoxin